MNILVVDDNQGFLSDIEARCFLDGIEGVDCASNIDDAFKKSDEFDYDEIVVGGNLLSEIERDSFPAPTRAYARKAEDIALAEDKRIGCYGIVKNSGALLDAIDSGKTIGVTRKEERSDIRKEDERRPGPRDTQRREHRRADKDIREEEPEYYDDEEEFDDDYFKKDYDRGRVIDRNERRHDTEKRSGDRYDTDRQNRGNRRESSRNEYQNERDYDEPRERSYRETEEEYSKPRRESRDRYAGRDERDSYRGDDYYREERSRQPAAKGLRNSVLEQRSNNNIEEAERAVDRDMGNVKDPAKVVTVFSAKGGVGKTTISCELATFLALSAHGRDRLKVCLVDFNVDFGDVLNTLALSPKHKGMTSWSARIKEDLERLPGDHTYGYTDEELDNLYYSKADMDEWLQVVEESGLSVLIAPITNEDSMNLMEDGEDVRVILNNLVNNSDFDYVICDTGNNTRNSSFIPLEMADDILMIVTQSVNTANCNASFLSTLKTVGFNTNTIKIIINRARSKKITGIAVDELLEVMTDPATGRPFECAGIIKETGDVEVMGNRGIPISYDPSNPFTKSIAEVARCVNEQTFTLEKPEKQGLFGRRKRK